MLHRRRPPPDAVHQVEGVWIHHLELVQFDAQHLDKRVHHPGGRRSRTPRLLWRMKHPSLSCTGSCRALPGGGLTSSHVICSICIQPTDGNWGSSWRPGRRTSRPLGSCRSPRVLRHARWPLRWSPRCHRDTNKGESVAGAFLKENSFRPTSSALPASTFGLVYPVSGVL